MVTLFFNLFNECLKEFTGDKSYNFLPYGFMVNEAGANFNTIQAVFGKEMLDHTVTCQWHFKACAKQQLSSILQEDQNTFMEMIGKLCKTYVRSEYIGVVMVLAEICKRKINSWWEWWGP